MSAQLTIKAKFPTVNRSPLKGPQQPILRIAERKNRPPPPSVLFFETEKEEKDRNPIPKEWNLYYLLIWPNPDIKSQCFINTHKVPEPEGIDLQYTLSFAVTFLLQQIPKISNLANFCNKPLYLQTDTIYDSLERRFIQESSRLDRCRRRGDSPLRSILLRIDRHPRRTHPGHR